MPAGPATREAVLTGLMPTAPTDHGYRHLAWATPLLVAHLRRGGVWRHAKGRVLANEPTPDLGDSLGRVCDELFMMSNSEQRKLAGVQSQNFWPST